MSIGKKLWYVLIVVLTIIILMCAAGGCNSSTGSGFGNWFGGGNENPVDIPITGMGGSIKINGLFTLFMVCTVAGIIAGLAGLKVGWLVAAGNIGGIVLSLTIAQYGKFLAIGGLVAAIVTVVAMLLRNRQFQVQSVKAVQQLKKELPNKYKEKINNVFWKNQNKTTEKIVQNIKFAFKKKILKIANKEREQSRKIQVPLHLTAP